MGERVREGERREGMEGEGTWCVPHWIVLLSTL